MKKKILVPMLLVATVFSTINLKVEAKETPTLDNDDIVTMSTSYEKIVTRRWSTAEYYDDHTQDGYKPIPRTIKQYGIKNGQYYSGTLKLTTYYRAPGEYVATYVGNMFPDNSVTPQQILNQDIK